MLLEKRMKKGNVGDLSIKDESNGMLLERKKRIAGDVATLVGSKDENSLSDWVFLVSPS
jgi:hypothetical protein